MAIGINIEKDDDEDCGPLTHWLESKEDENPSFVSKKRTKKVKDGEITPFTHLKNN